MSRVGVVGGSVFGHLVPAECVAAHFPGWKFSAPGRRFSQQATGCGGWLLLCNAPPCHVSCSAEQE